MDVATLQAAKRYAKRRDKVRDILSSLPRPANVYQLSTLAPTITLGAGNSTTTSITGGIQKQPRAQNVAQSASGQFVNTAGDPHFRYYGLGTTPMQYGSSFPSYNVTGPPLLNGGASQAAYWRPKIGFYLDGSVFEFLTFASSTSISYRLTVDGARITEDMATIGGASSGQIHLVKVDFGSIATRRIELEIGSFGGLFIEPTASLWRTPEVARFKFAGFGDSITGGANGVGPYDTWVSRTSDLLGADEWFNLAIGGSGFNPGAITASSFRSRIVDIQAANPDVLIYFGGYNDALNVSTPTAKAALQAEALLCYQAVQAALPECIVIVAGMYDKSSVTPTTSLDTNDALKTAAATAGLPFIDVLDPTGELATAPAWAATTVYPPAVVTRNGMIYASGAASTSTSTFDTSKFRRTSWINGTGRSAEPTGSSGNLVGDGTADVLITNDGTHPTLRGHKVFARRFTEQIITKLRVMAG